MEVSEVEYAWASGILEGEGCFSLHLPKGKNVPQTAIHCEMTDKDIIYRLRDVFGVGNINYSDNVRSRKDSSKRKPTYIWSVQSKSGCMEVLLRVMPYLGERRLRKASEMLESIEKRGY